MAEKNSLWKNIRNKAKQNRASGATPKEPTKKMLNQERKIKAKYPDGGLTKKRLEEVSQFAYKPKATITKNEPRSGIETFSQFLPGYETYLDMKDIYEGVINSDKESLNRGVIGLGFPLSGKALSAGLDYVTEQFIGKKTADANANKRNEIVNTSTSDLQKIYSKYGPGGYDKWVKDGKPKLATGGYYPTQGPGKALFKGYANGGYIKQYATGSVVGEEGVIPTQQEPVAFEVTGPTYEVVADNPNNKTNTYSPDIVDDFLTFINPKNWGVNDYSNKNNFGQAYESAKKAGEQEFLFNNKRYNTKYAGTPRQEVGRYGVNGYPVDKKYIDDPAQVNLYPPFGRYLPGHIEASINNNQTSVDYSPIGNFPHGLPLFDKKAGEKTYNVFGQNNLTFSNKAASLPTGDYLIEDEYKPSDWNLFTNNCADNVCDAFGIPRSNKIETPQGTMEKIKKGYPTMDITGRSLMDYNQLNEVLQTQPNKKILSQANNILGIASSPDIQKSGLGKSFISTIQGVLADEGYDLSKSLKEEGNYDGVYGPETKKALADWQNKNKKKQAEGGYTINNNKSMKNNNQSWKEYLKYAQGGRTNPYNQYQDDQYLQYAVGGKGIKNFATAFYGAGEGILDTITGGATDELTDRGFEALTKAGNKNIDLNNPDDVKFLKTQQKLKGYGNAAGAVGTAIATGNVQGAIKQGSKGLNTAFQATDGMSDEFKKWSQGISSVAGVASGFAGGLNSQGFSDAAKAGTGSAGFGQKVGKYSPLIGQASGMIGGNNQPLWQQGQAKQDFLNSPEQIAAERERNENYTNQGLMYGQGGNMSNNSLNLRNTMGYNKFAQGGAFNQYGINMIPESAGLHHQSAYGGVPIGPNALAEGGEIKMDNGDGSQYIVSDQVDGAETQKDFTFSKGGKYKELNRTLADGMKQDLNKYTYGSLATSDRVKGNLRRPNDSYAQSTVEQIKQKWQQKTEYARQRSQHDQAIAQAEEQKRMAEEQYIAAYGGRINPKKYPGLNMTKKAKGGYVHNQMIQPMYAKGGKTGPPNKEGDFWRKSDSTHYAQRGLRDDLMKVATAGTFENLEDIESARKFGYNPSIQEFSKYYEDYGKTERGKFEKSRVEGQAGALKDYQKNKYLSLTNQDVIDLAQKVIDNDGSYTFIGSMANGSRESNIEKSLNKLDLDRVKSMVDFKMKNKSTGGYYAQGGPLYGDPASPYTYAQGGMYGDPYARGGQIDYTNDMYSMYAGGGPMPSNLPQAFNGPSAQNRGGMYLYPNGGPGVIPTGNPIYTPDSGIEQFAPDASWLDGGNQVAAPGNVVSWPSYPEEYGDMEDPEGVSLNMPTNDPRERNRRRNDFDFKDLGRMWKHRGSGRSSGRPQSTRPGATICTVHPDGGSVYYDLGGILPPTGTPPPTTEFNFEQNPNYLVTQNGPVLATDTTARPQPQPPPVPRTPEPPENSYIQRPYRKGHGTKYYNLNSTDPEERKKALLANRANNAMIDIEKNKGTGAQNLLSTFSTMPTTRAEGGMMPPEQQMMQQAPQEQMQQQGGQEQMMQMVQQVAQAIMQGENPEQIMAELANSGMPQEQVQQVMQAAMQMANQQQQQQPMQGQEQMMPQQGMMARGGYFNGKKQYFRGGDDEGDFYDALNSDDESSNNDSGDDSENEENTFTISRNKRSTFSPLSNESTMAKIAGLGQAVTPALASAFAFNKLSKRKIKSTTMEAALQNRDAEINALRDEWRSQTAAGLRQQRNMGQTAGSVAGNTRDLILSSLKEGQKPIMQIYSELSAANQQAKQQAALANKQAADDFAKENESMYQNAMQTGFEAAGNATKNLANYYAGKENRNLQRWQAMNTSGEDWHWTPKGKAFRNKNGAFYNIYGVEVDPSTGNPVDTSLAPNQDN